MSLITRFAGQYNALSFNYGGSNTGAPDAIDVLQGNPSTGAGTVYVAANFTVDQGANVFSPFVSGQTIQIGRGAALETVTLTAVGTPTLVGSEPSAYSISLSATFSYVHGYGDPVFSATYGLQEAINVAAGSASGNGTIIVDEAWYAAGGTLAIILAAIIPVTANASNVSLANTLRILDLTTLTYYALRYSTVTALVAPTIPLSTQVASLAGVTGTFAASTTYYVNFAYVDAKGGITVASSQYSFTSSATANLAIGGSGPIAEIGAVGYLVWTSATTTTYLAPVVQVTGAAASTIITCGSVKCFQIGTPFAVASPGTSALAIVPVEATAYAAAVLPIQSQNMIQPFNTVLPPFVATGLISGTALEMARQDFPAGYLNSLGRTLMTTAIGTFTPVSGATLTFSVELWSVYGHTGTVIVTVGPTAVTSGTAAPCNFIIECWITTAATGATGTLEVHARFTYQLVATTVATTGVAATSLDNTSAPSGTVDLTKQGTLSFLLLNATQNITTAQVRQLITQVLV